MFFSDLELINKIKANVLESGQGNEILDSNEALDSNNSKYSHTVITELHELIGRNKFINSSILIHL